MAPTMRLNLTLGLVALLQTIANFVAQLMVIRIIGAGLETDAYVAALAFPTLMFAVLGLSMQNVWLPILARADAGSLRSVVEEGLGQTMAFVVVCAVVLGVTTAVWAPLLLPGFTPEQLALTSVLLRILLLGGVFTCATAILTVMGRSANRFVLVEVVPLAVSLMAIAVLPFVLPATGVLGAAWIFSFRAAIVFAVLWFILGRPRARLATSDAKKQAARQLKPLIAGSSLYKLAPLVDRYWGSSSSLGGGLTIYTLVQSGLGAAAMILDRTFATTAGPSLARYWHARDLRGFRRAYRRAVVAICLCVAAGGLLLYLIQGFWLPLLALVLKIEMSQAALAATLIYAFLGYVAVAAAGNVLVTAFYATGDARTPVLIGSLGFIGGTVLKSFAFLSFDLVGKAAATTVY